MKFKEFWAFLGAMLAALLVLVIIIGGSWAGHRTAHSRQDRLQAALLAELSDYSGEVVNTDRESPVVEELVKQIRFRFADSEDMEADLTQWFKVVTMLPGDTRSRVKNLLQTFPGAIATASQGDTTPARELEEKWLTGRYYWVDPAYVSTISAFFFLGVVVILLFISSFGQEERLKSYQSEYEDAKEKLKSCQSVLSERNKKYDKLAWKYDDVKRRWLEAEQNCDVSARRLEDFENWLGLGFGRGQDDQTDESS